MTAFLLNSRAMTMIKGPAQIEHPFTLYMYVIIIAFERV